MAVNVERELKLAPPPGFTSDAICALGGEFVASHPERRRLHTLYYDTDDLRLLRWACSLRYRVGEGWTVKLPRASAQGLTREEWTFDGERGAVPHDAADLVLAFTRGAPLKEVAELRTLRTTVHLLADDTREVARIDDDDAHIIGGKADGERFRQLEVELLNDAPPEVMMSLRERLRAAGVDREDPTPKVARALGLSDLPSPEIEKPELDRKSSMGDVLRGSLADSVQQLVRSDPAIRTGADATSVHEARTAVRRMRSDLRVFRRVLERPWAGALAERLARLGDVLGAARDADVMLERIRACEPALPADDARATHSLVDAYERARDETRERLRAALREPTYRSLIDEVVEAANRPRMAPGAAGRAEKWMPKLLRRTWRSAHERVERLDGTPTNRQLHQVRIAAKRLRYAVEAFEPVAGRPARSFMKRLQRLTALLGDEHDAVVNQQRLRVLAQQPELAFVAGELTALEGNVVAAVRREWRAAWRKATAKRTRFWR
jgi:CHAD domain-containing protein